MDNKLQRPKPTIPPTVAFSLAAVVRTRSSPDAPKIPQYVLVHEKPPRGWWLPGGGIEHSDFTPVEAAVREIVEEAAAKDAQHLQKEQLPKITHLLSVQQSPGRIRFIFRGEWLDDTGSGVLKLPPGDDESIEAKWVTLDEVKSIPLSKHSRTRSSSPAGKWDDPWLRGYEPLTFFEMLESNDIPGLPVCDTTDATMSNQDLIGAFFKRSPQRTSIDHCTKPQVSYRGRDALMTDLHARLVVYEESKQKFLVNKATGNFPSGRVTNQYGQSLKQLVDGMIAASLNDRSTKAPTWRGILRVEYTIHGHGEASLTVFPCVIVSSDDMVSVDNMKLVSVDDLEDDLEMLLAKALIGNATKLRNLDILVTKE